MINPKVNEKVLEWLVPAWLNCRVTIFINQEDIDKLGKIDRALKLEDEKFRLVKELMQHSLDEQEGI